MSKLFSQLTKGVRTASRDLVQLVNRNGIPCPHGIGAHALLERMQKEWLRTENDHTAPATLATGHDLLLLQALGMTQEIKPTNPSGNGFEGTILLGGSPEEICQCDKFISNQSQQRIEIGSVYVLMRQPSSIPTNKDLETLMREMKRVQAIWKVDTDAEFTHAPLQKEGDGKLRFPTTTETVQEFIHSRSCQGIWLVVSSQPFIQRNLLDAARAADLENALGYTFIEAGPAADPDLSLAIYLNEVKRLLEQSLAV